MDALNFLKHQHREVEALFGKVAHARDAETRRRLFTQIDDALRLHSHLEETIFYPELRRRAEKHEQRLEVTQAYEEHAVVASVSDGAAHLAPDTEQYEAKLNVLKSLVQHHVDEEEENLFKIAHHLFSKEELEQLGNRLKEAAESRATA
jgi:hypothetical protein